MSHWKTYVKGDLKRQEILKTSLKRISDGGIEGYMSKHRYDDNIEELKNHFDTVIDWADSAFGYTGNLSERGFGPAQPTRPAGRGL